ncbi:MAG: hypothetical protein CO114_07790 [Euryarchaeota archaeon CG_4_9_14_3_um_filter_38_12]|nr:MAG: hypothetical protein CO114_07790 [Euryarchaeota archaeon CG_4_9_14_3_um_filter_38_12]
MRKNLWKKLRKHRGAWVAVYNDELISFGEDAASVYKKAKKMHEKPILFQVPTKEEEVCIL